MTDENKDSSTELSPASKLSLHHLFPVINIGVYPCASVVLSNHPGFHIIPSVTPSGFDFVGNRYRGLRFAHAPAIIMQPVPGFQNESLRDFVYIICFLVINLLRVISCFLMVWTGDFS